MKNKKLKKLIKKTIREQQQDINVGKADSMGSIGSQGLQTFDPNENPLLVKDPSLDLTGAGQSTQAMISEGCNGGDGVVWSGCYQNLPYGNLPVSVIDANNWATDDGTSIGGFENEDGDYSLIDPTDPNVTINAEGNPCAPATEDISDIYICCSSTNNGDNAYENVGGAINIYADADTAFQVNEGLGPSEVPCYCPDPVCCDANGNEGDCGENEFPLLKSCGIVANTLTTFDFFLTECAGVTNGVEPNYYNPFLNTFEVISGGCTQDFGDECQDNGEESWSVWPGFEALNYNESAEINDPNACDYTCIGCGNENANNYGVNMYGEDSLLDCGDDFQDCDGSVSSLGNMCCEYNGCATIFATNTCWDSEEQNYVTCEQDTDPVCDFPFCGTPGSDNYICDDPQYNTTLCIDEVPIGTDSTLVAQNPDVEWWPNITLGAFTGTCLDETSDVVPGCMIYLANNYAGPGNINGIFPFATEEDGSCIWNVCDDPNAFGMSEIESGNIYCEYPDDPGKAQFCDDCGFIDVPDSPYNGEFNCVADTSLCIYEGCADPTGVPMEFQTNASNSNYAQTDTGLESHFGQALYYYNEYNTGCQTMGDEPNAQDNWCCPRPGCPDPDASFVVNEDEEIIGECPCGTSAFFSYGATYDPLGYGESDSGEDDYPLSCGYDQEGCMDATAINYDPNATNQATSGPNVCQYGKTVEAIQCGPLPIQDENGIYTMTELETLVETMLAPGEPNPISEQIAQYGNGWPGGTDIEFPRTFENVVIGESNVANGAGEMMPFLPGDVGAPDMFLAMGETYTLAGCNQEAACNYTELATEFAAGSCVYPDGWPNNIVDCNGNCLSDVDGDGICDDNEIAGCTNDLAQNYNVNATDDDGSCTYAAIGCMNPQADNYLELVQNSAGEMQEPNISCFGDSCCSFGCVCCDEEYDENGALAQGPMWHGGYCYPAGLPDFDHNEFCYGLGGSNMSFNSAASKYNGCPGAIPGQWSCYNTAGFTEDANDCSDGGLICFIICFCPNTTNWMAVWEENNQWPPGLPHCLENGYNPSDCWGLGGTISGTSEPSVMSLAHEYIQDRAYQGRGDSGICECGYKAGTFPTWGWPKLSEYGCPQDIINE